MRIEREREREGGQKKERKKAYYISEEKCRPRPPARLVGLVTLPIFGMPGYFLSFFLPPLSPCILYRAVSLRTDLVLCEFSVCGDGLKMNKKLRI